MQLRGRLIAIAAGIVLLLLVVAHVVAGAAGSNCEVAVVQVFLNTRQSQTEVVATFAAATPTPTGN